LDKLNLGEVPYSVPVHLASVRVEKEKVLDFLAFFASLREISCAQRPKERKGKHRRAGFQPGYTVFLWNLPDLTKSRQWLLPGGTTVTSAAGTSDGRYLATGTMGVVTLFRLYPKAKTPPTDCMK
jgi:hypothetical protein